MFYMTFMVTARQTSVTDTCTQKRNDAKHNTKVVNKLQGKKAKEEKGIKKNYKRSLKQ